MRRLMLPMMCAIVIGCGSQIAPPAVGKMQNGIAKSASFAPPDDSAALAEHTRGAELMGQYHYLKAVPIFDQLAKKYPNWLDLHVDLAIATLNFKRATARASAMPIVKQVLERDPDHCGNFVAGFLYAILTECSMAFPFLESRASGPV